jgi:hypothetical protein
MRLTLYGRYTDFGLMSLGLNKSRHGTHEIACPLYPRKPTLDRLIRASAKGHYGHKLCASPPLFAASLTFLLLVGSAFVIWLRVALIGVAVGWLLYRLSSRTTGRAPA